MFAVASYCGVCKTAVISAKDGVTGVCSRCAQQHAQEGEAWVEFMRERFLPLRPLKGETFAVKVVIQQCEDGRWFAFRSVGSNLVKPRVSSAAKRDSELEARRFLGLKD
jgi:hypothetical protein